MGRIRRKDHPYWRQAEVPSIHSRSWLITELFLLSRKCFICWKWFWTKHWCLDFMQSPPLCLEKWQGSAQNDSKTFIYPHIQTFHLLQSTNPLPLAPQTNQRLVRGLREPFFSPPVAPIKPTATPVAKHSLFSKTPLHEPFLGAVFLSRAPYPFTQASGPKVATCSFPKGSGTYQLKQQFKGDRLGARLTCLQSCRPLCCTLITRWTKTIWRIIPALALIISRRAFLLLRLHATQSTFKDWGRCSVIHHSGSQRFSLFVLKYFLYKRLIEFVWV